MPIDNCALLIQYYLEVNDISLNLCGSCESGYYPIYSDLYPYIVTDCLPISHCEENSVNNFCKKCQQGYAFIYTE